MGPDVAVRLTLERLEKRFGTEPVLAGVELEVEPGETLALLGPSGSGKTTALRIVAGFETADSGRVLVDGEDVSRAAPADRRFGMVFQHYALFPHLDVAGNVAFGLETAGVEKARRRARVDEMLELVGLGGLGGRRIAQLSGGQQQRVALARALAPSPRVLLLDEPLSNLDPALRERTRTQLRETVAEVGITAVLVTHEQEEAFHVGDRVAVLHRGRLEQIGRPEDLYRRPASRFVAGFVGRASELRGRVEGVDGEGTLRVRIDGSDAVWTVDRTGGDAEGPLDDGSRVVLVARPEALELVAPGAPDALPARPVARRFTGPLTYRRVVTDGGIELEVAEARESRDATEDGAADAGGAVGVRPRGTGPGPFVFPEAG